MIDYYINMRAGAVSGGIAEPYVLKGDYLAPGGGLAAAPWTEVPGLARNMDVVFGVHGFNVSYASGVRSLGELGRELGLPPTARFFGVLWPGDFWLPVINYPFEGADAVTCGRKLAAFCERWFADAHSVSFISHSLGARLVLEAAKTMRRKVRVMCLTAAAVDNDCLTGPQYRAALANTEHAYVLSSGKDNVLKLAYPLGDFAEDVFAHDDNPFRGALGLHGPRPNAGPTVRPRQIPDGQKCGHTDYFPAGAHHVDVAGFAAAALGLSDSAWPPAV